VQAYTFKQDIQSKKSNGTNTSSSDAVFAEFASLITRRLRKSIDHSGITYFRRKRKRNKSQQRRWRVKPWIGRRILFGQYYTLLERLYKLHEDAAIHIL